MLVIACLSASALCLSQESWLTSQRNVIVVLQSPNGINLSSNVELVSSAEEVFHSRMFLIAAKNLLGFLGPAELSMESPFLSSSDLLVWLVDILDVNDSQIAVVTEIAQCNACSRFYAELLDQCFGDVESNGHGEEVAVRKAVILNNAIARIRMLVFAPEWLTYPL